MEEELSKMSVAQLKAICAGVGIPEGRNRRLTAQALKAVETAPGLSDGSNSAEGEEENNSSGEGEPSDNLMQKVLKELTSLKRKVKASSVVPSEVGNVKQLTELYDELVREQQAKKIYPDRDFEKEHNQNKYNTCGRIL